MSAFLQVAIPLEDFVHAAHLELLPRVSVDMHSAIDPLAISNLLPVCQDSPRLLEILVQPVVPSVPPVVSAISDLAPSLMPRHVDVQSHLAALAPPAVELLGYQVDYAGVTRGLGVIQGPQVVGLCSEFRDIFVEPLGKWIEVKRELDQKVALDMEIVAVKLARPVYLVVLFKI